MPKRLWATAAAISTGLIRTTAAWTMYEMINSSAWRPHLPSAGEDSARFGWKDSQIATAKKLATKIVQ